MRCQPEVLLNHARGKPKISVILIDWGVRESFHSLHYLNRQTVPRDEYELLWLEFYDRKPAALRQMIADHQGEQPLLDKWLVLGYPDTVLYHKHRLYNLGILAAAGEVCVLCDSDAIFTPTFIENLIRAFEETPNQVIHLDEARNSDRRFYPFNYPPLDDVLGPGCVNWCELTTRGLITRHDRLHQADYGACMAARRKDLLAIGGADEHRDFLGHISGPYDLTFRLVNYFGRDERWLRNEYLYHTWHPNESDGNTEYHGPHDGEFMALRALDARASFQIKPCVPNPWINTPWPRAADGLQQLLQAVQSRPEADWQPDLAQTSRDNVYWVVRGLVGFNIFAHAGEWFALPERDQAFDPRKERAGGYSFLVRKNSLRALEVEIVRKYARSFLEQEKSPLRRLFRTFRTQPLHRLPVRLWRRTERLLATLVPPRPPWELSKR